MPLLAFLACQSPIVCQDLRTEDAGNLVQPFDVAVDPVRRRALVTAHAAAQVAVVDIDTREFVDRVQYGAVPLDTPRVAVDGAGTVYLTSHAKTHFLRADIDAETRTWIDSGYRGLREPVGLASGFAALAAGEGDSDVVLYDGSGRLVSSSPAGDGSALFVVDGGAALALLRASGDIERLSIPALTSMGRCPLGIAAQAGAQLDNGVLVLAAADQVAIVDCGSEAQVLAVGVDNKDVVSLGDRAVVFDRVGSGDDADPNLGLARVFDASGLVAGPFATGKNSGFAGADPQSGSAWVNSEGTAEVVRIDLSTGGLDAVKLGQHIDGLALDPREGREGGLVVTGRLSSRVARLDEIQSGAQPPGAEAETFWPYSPVIDTERGRLYVLRQADMVVECRDPDSLQGTAEFDPGLGPNTSLYFGTLALHTGRDTIILAHPEADMLVELSHAGDVVNTVPLGGPPLDDDDHLGELQVLVTGDGNVVVLRSGDGRLQRIDLDAGVTAQADLGNEFAAAVDILRADEANERLYVGGRAFDINDLVELEGQERAVARMVGPDPDHEDGWIAVDPTEQELLRLDADGVVTGRAAFAKRERKSGRFLVDAEARAVVMARSQAAHVCVVPTVAFAP